MYYSAWTDEPGLGPRGYIMAATSADGLASRGPWSHSDAAYYLEVYLVRGAPYKLS
jgi:hypothetical protein